MHRSWLFCPTRPVPIRSESKRLARLIPTDTPKKGPSPTSPSRTARTDFLRRSALQQDYNSSLDLTTQRASLVCIFSTSMSAAFTALNNGFDTVCLKACPTCLPSSRSALLSRSDYYVGSVGTQQALADLGTLSSYWVYPGFAGPFTSARRRSRLPKCPLYPVGQPGYRERSCKTWYKLRASEPLGGHLLDHIPVLQYSRGPPSASRQETCRVSV